MLASVRGNGAREGMEKCHFNAKFHFNALNFGWSVGGNGENQERFGKMLKNPEQNRKNPKKSGIKNWNRCNIIAKLANIG